MEPIYDVGDIIYFRRLSNGKYGQGVILSLTDKEIQVRSTGDFIFSLQRNNIEVYKVGTTYCATQEVSR